MDRVIAANSVNLANADTAPGSGTPQYFTSGNPETSTPATVLPGWWLNQFQEELRNAVIAGGLSPTRFDWTKLWQSMLTTRSIFMDTGSANALVAGLQGSLAITGIATGTEVTIMIANSNTGATTLDFGGITKNVKMPDGTTALLANSIIANQPARFYYDGTVWRLYLGLTDKILSCNPRNSALVGASSDGTTLLDITLGFGLEMVGTVLTCTL